MIKNKSTLILATSILTMLIAIGALVFFYKVIQNKNKHTDALVSTLRQKMVEKSNSVALQEKSAKIEEIRKTIDSYFVDPDKIDSFVNYLESLGATAGTDVNVEDFQVSTTAKNTLNVRVTTEGTFSNVMRVLMLVENAPYKIHIEKVLFNHSITTVPAPVVVAAKDAQSKTPTEKQPDRKVMMWQGDISFTILLSQ